MKGQEPAEQRIAEIRERLDDKYRGTATLWSCDDITYLLDLLASQDRALEEAQLTVEKFHLTHCREHEEDCTMMADLDAMIGRLLQAVDARTSERDQARAAMEMLDAAYCENQQQLTAAQGEIARLKQQFALVAKSNELLTSRAEQAEAERARLREALKPFLRRWMDNPNASTYLWTLVEEYERELPGSGRRREMLEAVKALEAMTQ